MSKLLTILAISLLSIGCATVGAPDKPDNRATLKLQSHFQEQYTNNLFLKVAAIDGVKASKFSNVRKSFRVAPGKHSIQVAGDFEYSNTSVVFTLTAKPRETYHLTGRFELLRNGGIKHIYALQNARGAVLQRKEAVTRL